jgi:hypothetical protein
MLVAVAWMHGQSDTFDRDSRSYNRLINHTCMCNAGLHMSAPGATPISLSMVEEIMRMFACETLDRASPKVIGFHTMHML